MQPSLEYGTRRSFLSDRLQIQALWLTLSLRLKNTLPRSPEVLHIDPHTTLTESHESGFGADGLDVSTRKIVLLVDELVEIDILVERHLGGVERKDLLLCGFCMMVSIVIVRSYNSAYGRGSRKESFDRYVQDE